MINLVNINKKYGDIVLYKDLNCEFGDNRITAIIGPSGCGKTTLLNVIASLENVDSGDVLGIDQRKLAYIFQEPRLLPWLTVYENIEIVLKLEKIHEEKKYIENVLKEVDLWEYQAFFPEQLSGGMQQRLAIARAFAVNSDIILMDEPFKSLDFDMKIQVINYFKKIWIKRKQQVIFVTHDFLEASLVGDVIYLLTNKPVSIYKEIENPVNISERAYNNLDILKLEQDLYKNLQ